mgnify:CR=1 FL=1|jgi:hypothetical protein
MFPENHATLVIYNPSSNFTFLTMIDLYGDAHLNAIP